MSTQPGAEALPDAWIRRLTIAFCVVAIVLAAVQAWTVRFDMNLDGVQYLDNADAYRTGDSAHAVNSQWSPLYPWLIGGLFNILRPTRFQEFPLVHLLNFVLFAATLAAFLFFIRTLRPLLPRRGQTRTFNLMLLCYSTFLYCSLDFTSLSYVTPDLLVSLFVFLAAGMLTRIAAGIAATSDYAALGLTLGFGYLAKAPFLLLGLLCLAMTVVVARRQPFALRRIVLATALFAAIAAPYILVLSNFKGRFTLGDSGKFNIIWMVNGISYHHWQGGQPDHGAPLHPSRQLSIHPAIFEFATPIAGTYPPWYDPIYWNEGARIAWRPIDFARSLVRQLRLYGNLLHHRQVPLVSALLVLFLWNPEKRKIPRLLGLLWPVLLLGAAPFVLYAPIHAEGRYLGSFFVLLWTSLFFAALQSSDDSEVRVPTVVARVAALLMLVEGLTAAFPAPPITYAHDQAVPDSRRMHYEIAGDLQALGLKPGDPVAIVNGDLPYYWARLAGVHIIMEIFFDQQRADPESQWVHARAILAQHGAAFVVSPWIAGVVDQPGWRRLGNTGAFAYAVQRDGQTPPVPESH